MGAKRKVDWIIAHDGTAGDKAYALECLRCGTLQKLELPMSINCFVAFAGGFEKEHRRCKAVVAESER